MSDEQNQPPASPPESEGRGAAWPPAPPGYGALPAGAVAPRYESLVGLSRWVVWLIAATMLTYIITAILEPIFGDIASQPPTTTRAIVLIIVLGVVDLIQFVIFIAGAVVFLRWIFVAYRNLKAFGASGLSTTPGLAVAYFFIPILNLYKPCQIVAETWKASAPANSTETLPARASGSGVALIGWWWAFWLISNFASGLVGVAAATHSAPKDDWFSVFVASVLNVISCIFAIMLVRALTERQEGAARKLAQAGAGS